MERIAAPLRQMGAKIVTTERGTAPVRIYGGQQLEGIEYAMPIASAQVKSGLLLAGLYGDGETRIQQTAVTRDHTERMLQVFGVVVEQQGDTVVLPPHQTLRAANLEIPADISSAAFFIVAATLAPGSDLLIERVGVNPTRTGVLDILRLMGADIQLENTTQLSGEPVADIRVKSAQLQGIDIPEHLISTAIDEFPALFIAAAAAKGTTRLRGASELRFKESDRISAMAEGLERLGIHTRVDGDAVEIQGGILQGGRVRSHGDHRIAMAFAVAGVIAEKEVIVDACNNVATSFPDFVEVAQKAGVRIIKEET